LSIKHDGSVFRFPKPAIATRPPTASDDEAQGYSIGSPWYDYSARIEWRCASAAVGAAVWAASYAGTIRNGTVDPTTEGVNGDFYINTSTSTLFGPKAAGVWPVGVSLVGPQGDRGGLRYNFSTSTSVPGTAAAGGIRYNNATIGSATQLQISKIDQAGNDQSGFIDTWDDSGNPTLGYLSIKGNSNSSTVVNVWEVTSVSHGGGIATGDYVLDVVYLSGDRPANGLPCVVEFYRT
jgi:hypothetical protein